MRTTRLRVSLRDVSPAVVRVIDVPATSTLPELHDLLQAALGWTDSHLHQFIAGDRTYVVPDPDWEDELYEDETRVKLRELATRFVYLYDLGDYWNTTSRCSAPASRRHRDRSPAAPGGQPRSHSLGDDRCTAGCRAVLRLQPRPVRR